MFEIPKSKEYLKDFLRDLPNNPGVYKFLDAKDQPLYIGKAKNIKKRVTSYFLTNKNNTKKIASLLSNSLCIKLTITSSELEALILEQVLIKQYKPKFNVQFKDDKGYPWIRLEVDKAFPSASIFFGKKDFANKYFGPFPNSFAVKEVLSLIQKTFKLRNCSDSFFKNRSRPCIQHQIGRCSAPCTNLISKIDYDQDVRSTKMLLEGKSENLIAHLHSMMDNYSNKKLYERAGSCRDKISAIREIQRAQSISGFSNERDAIVIISINNITKIGITHVAGGWITGHDNFTQDNSGIEEGIIETFLLSHYLESEYCPSFLIVTSELQDKVFIERALSSIHKKIVKILTRPSKKDMGLLDIAYTNTRLAVEIITRKKRNISYQLNSLKQQLNLKTDIKVIDSFDISHHSGSNAVGACVVYDKKGKESDKYRLYNISKKNSGNDIASMQEVIERRYGGNNNLPSLIIIDGGLNHLRAVETTLKKLAIERIDIISISKGVRRKADFDSIHMVSGHRLTISRNSSAHLLLQEIRDETHRFGIVNQKKKQLQSSLKSDLSNIPGLGKARKKSLLRYFGSLEQLKRASSKDLKKVSGIGDTLALEIYNTYN